MKKYISKSKSQTEQIASRFAKAIGQSRSKNNVIALSGNLGAGKTTFVQGFAKGLGIKDKIISPTFVLIRQHKIPKTSRTLFHIDLYRLPEAVDIKELGLNEIWSDQNHIVLIEWADRIKKIPNKSIKILIAEVGHNKRLITIK